MNNFGYLNKIGWRLGFLVAVLFSVSHRLPAQIGNGNPTGPAGAFNGNITTGCSYDPLTGNAKRAVTDLVVAGAVGRYPLAFGRTANSRYQRDDDFAFGPSGGWRHSYAWDIDGSNSYPTASTPPTVYPVSFPDGRAVTFWASSSDIYFRGPPGVKERFQPLNFSTMRAYLILPDGGKIEFKATRHSECIPELHRSCTYTYTYQAQAIFDPFGLKTTLTYNSDGSLNTVQEFGGRWLQLFYVNDVIDHVLASDGRVVQYNYLQGTFSPGTSAYTYLANVVYPFEPSLGLSPTAVYAYQAPNGSNPNGYPLLSSCDDPMYGGPMKKISFSYATNNGGSIPVVAGQILSENSGTTGQVVSQLYVQTTTWRNEIRGDGPVRHLEYDGALLKRFTDFKNVQSFQSYDGNSYVNLISDGNQHVTDIVNNPLTGATTQVTYPLTPSESVRASVQYVYGGPSCDDPKNQDGNNPYYLCRVTDERGNFTRYWRDDSKRVTQITYPDGTSETFAYNNLNQVTSHRLRPLSASIPGGLETFVYDSSGKLLQYRDPYHPAVIDSQHPEIPTTALSSTTYGYDSLGRVASVTDAANHATTFLYTTRGQLTRVTHAVDGSYTQAAYNADGTLAWAADENHPGAAADPNQRERLGYDDYKRVISVTRPGLPPATFTYAQDFVNSYVHTTSNVKGAFSPMGKTVHYAYDENWQRTIKREAPETTEDAWTFYGYDNIGNMTWVQDPRGKVTNIGYDQRNRRTSLTNPVPFNNEITRWEYDPASNITKVTRPDLAYRRAVYDSMNRVTDTYGFANERTQFFRDLAGDVIQMIDSKNASYGFGYDLLNRRVSASYPADVYNIQRTESWRYDTVGRMDLYRNLADEYKHIEYDSRNRPQRSYWNWSATSTTPDWFGPETTSQFDAGSRLTNVATKLWGTNNNETVVAFGYDNTNRKIWEEQTLFGYPARRLETGYDNDGNRIYLHLPGFYLHWYDYTQRNQPFHIADGGGNTMATYTYDTAGNMTHRQGNWPFAHGSHYSYDALNRMETLDQGDQNQYFQHNHYKYDNVGREVATWRDEQSNKGERYWYSADSQLSAAVYNADNVATGNPSNWSKRRDYYFSTGLLNWQWVNDNGYWAPFANNGVNQYTSVNGSAPQYDGNLNLTGLSGFSGSYDAENRLIWGSRNGNTILFTYDGLGRCVRRTLNGNSATLFTYDGWNPIIDWNQGGGWKTMNHYGAGSDELLSRYDAVYGAQIYKQDKRGNVTFMLNASNQIIEKYTYDAFGTPTITDANGAVRTESLYGNRFMFTGREYIKELGVYDFRNRVYDPGIGRFLQSDPIGFAAGDPNLFRYCANDPVNRTDPSGLTPDPRLYNEDRNSGPSALGDWNWSLGSGSGPASTQGFWSGPSGIPTGVPGGGPGTGSRLGNGGSSGGTSLGWVGTAEAVTQGVVVTATSINPSPDINPAADFFGFRLGDVRWLPQRMPDYFQFSFSVPVPQKGFAWFGAQGALSFYPRTGHMFLGLGPGVGVPQNLGAMISGNWVGSWSSPNSPPVSGQSSASLDLSGAINVGGSRSWSLTGDANSFGIGLGSKGVGLGGIGTIQLWGQLWGPKG